MSARTLGLLLVGLVLGPIVVGIAASLGGLTWVTLAGTSDVEGLSGLVAASWIVAAVGLGLIVGLGWLGWRSGR